MPPFRRPPIQQFEKVANFRDLGGHSTTDGRQLRSGMLFRSGHLGHTTDEDLGVLEALGLRTVFDFRTPSDIEADGADRLPDATRHVQLPMPDPAAGEDIRALMKSADDALIESTFGNGQAAAMMRTAAASMVRERSQAYRVFLRELTAPGALPALFHCSAGKDRAGWAGTVVLLALGVHEEEIVEQYLLSNREVERIRERLQSAANPAWSDLLFPLLEVRREYIESSFAALREDWGDADRYLREGLELSDAQRDALRESLLE